MESDERELFGTDGIRGEADAFPLDTATMFALGEALSHRLKAAGVNPPRVLLGGDTRESRPRIEASLAAGIEAGGGEAVAVGVIPTPGVAWLCRNGDADAGVSISASHNPWRDNGVKIFGGDGRKLPDRMELEIERELLEIRREDFRHEPATPVDGSDLVRHYEDFLVGGLGPNALSGSRVVLDAANGAAFEIAKRVFERTGANLTMIHDRPDGRNINLDCGALHPRDLSLEVVKHGAHLGVAFDGDADRAIFVDDSGETRDGDEALYLWALHLHESGELRGDLVVATVMSNLGLELRLREHAIELLRSKVGDKYVLELMQERGAVLGGEQSGHVIDLRSHATGDGIHTALVIASILSGRDQPFSRIETFPRMPQILVNQDVASKPPLESLERFDSRRRAAEETLGSRGRVLVRYSGTEKLVRIMVEGEEEEETRRIAEDLRSVLAEEIGTG